MYDKLFKLKFKLEQELEDFEVHVNPYSQINLYDDVKPASKAAKPVSNNAHFAGENEIGIASVAETVSNLPIQAVASSMGVNELEVLKVKSDLKKEVFEKENLKSLYDAQSNELESLRSKVKEWQRQVNNQNEKLQKNEKNMAVFISNLGNRVHVLGKENDILRKRCVEQTKSSSGFVDEVKFLKAELTSCQTTEAEQREAKNELMKRFTAREEEMMVLMSKVKKYEAERPQLVEEIRKARLENSVKEEFRAHKKNKSLAVKFLRWLSDPLLNFNTGRS